MNPPIFSIDLFRDLFGHMEWADALIWKAALATENALSSDELRKRLFHVHATQRVFYQVWIGEEPEHRRVSEFPALPALLVWSQTYYRDLGQFLEALDPVRLDEPMPVPWAHYFASRMGITPHDTTLGETMFQVVSHSTHHRAQNNLFLRELGARPPLVDYIGWLWMGRPAPEWPA